MSLTHRILIEVDRKFIHATQEGCLDWLEETAGIAKRNAPKDTGDLRDSGFVEPDHDLPESTHGEMEHTAGTIIFPLSYAAEQEENENYSHTDGHAHYTEDAVKTNASRLVAAIERRKRLAKL